MQKDIELRRLPICRRASISMRYASSEHRANTLKTPSPSRGEGRGGGAFLALLLISTAAQADKGELFIGAAPTISFIQRHDRLNHGAGGLVATRYGLSNNIFLEALFESTHLQNLANKTYASPHGPASLYYSATRFRLAPSIGLRLGHYFVTNLTAGLGYQAELQTARNVVVARNPAPEHEASRTIHALVGTASLGFEYRFCDRFSAAARASVAAPVAFPRDVDVNLALVLGGYFYP